MKNPAQSGNSLTSFPDLAAVRDLNQHGRGFGRRFKQGGSQLLLGWAGKDTAKPLSFEPRVTKVFPKASELVCHLQDDECDHGYRSALKSGRST